MPAIAPCCAAKTKLQANWDMLPPKGGSPLNSWGKLDGQWDSVYDAAPRSADGQEDGEARQSSTSRPCQCIALCALAAFALCILWLAWPSPEPSDPVPASPSATEGPGASTTALQVEISLPRFDELLDERYASHHEAWKALAGSSRSVEFKRFEGFASDLFEHLNSTQAWWVFSELDADQDFKLKDLEFYNRLAETNHLLPSARKLRSVS